MADAGESEDGRDGEELQDEDDRVEVARGEEELGEDGEVGIARGEVIDEELREGRLVDDEDHQGEEYLGDGELGEVGEDELGEVGEDELGEVGKDELGEVEETVGEVDTNKNMKGEFESVKGDQSSKCGGQRSDELSKDPDQMAICKDLTFRGDVDSDSTTELIGSEGHVLQSEACLDDDSRGSEDRDGGLHAEPADVMNKGSVDNSDCVTLDDSEQCYKSSRRKSKVGDTLIPKSAVQISRPLKSSDLDVSNRHSSSKLRRTKFKPTSDKSAKPVSSININISRIIDGDAEMEGSAVVATVTTKNVDFSLQTVVADEVEQELARAVGNDDTSMSAVSDFPSGRAAATNTPVDSHFIQHRSPHTPVRDNIYEHAVHLIKKRCQSRNTILSSRCPLQYWDEEDDDEDTPNAVTLPTLLSRINEPLFNNQPNKTFFITQHRPIPMEPLKVWKGYHANVFFQPLVCHKMRMSVSDKVPVNAVNAAARKPCTARTLDGRLPQLNHEGKNQRAVTAKTWNGRSAFVSADPRNMVSAAPRPVTRQMSVLDRQTVFSRMDQHFGEDIAWLNGTEALGALKVGTGRSRSSAHFYNSEGQHYKLRICRGLVSHNKASLTKEDPAFRGLVSHNKASLTKEDPTLDVSGGKMREAFKGPENGSNGQERRALRQRVGPGIHHQQATLSQDHRHSIHSKQVVVDLTTGNEIVKEYLVGAGLDVKLVKDGNKKVK